MGVFEIEKRESGVAFLFINRAKKLNSMNYDFWIELPEVVEDIENDDDIKVVIVAGRGKAFSIGLDLKDFANRFRDILFKESFDSRLFLKKLIKDMQKGFSLISESKKIYIAAVHKYCIGGGLDFIASCDIRVCTKDTIFSIKETKVGIVADLGSLNRLPFIIGEGNTKLMAFTGSDFDSDFAYRVGLVSYVYENKEEMFNEVFKLAKEIAENPYHAVYGSKIIMNKLYKDVIDKSLDYVALYNSSFLTNDDFIEILKRFAK